MPTAAVRAARTPGLSAFPPCRRTVCTEGAVTPGVAEHPAHEIADVVLGWRERRWERSGNGLCSRILSRPREQRE